MVSVLLRLRTGEIIPVQRAAEDFLAIAQRIFDDRLSACGWLFIARNE